MGRGACEWGMGHLNGAWGTEMEHGAPNWGVG